MPEVPYTQPPPRPEARRALEREALLPHIRHEAEIARGLELGLPGADSIVDRSIPTFSPGRPAFLRRYQHLSQGTLRRGGAHLR